MHVSDAVAALIALSECPEAIGQVFNAGSTEEISIGQLARKVLEVIDAEQSGSNTAKQSIEDRIELVSYEKAYSANFEDMLRRIPDISKIRTYTGWEPKHSLDKIIHDVVASTTAEISGRAG